MCGFKESCCEGEPARARAPGKMLNIKVGIVWAKCAHCDGEIMSFLGGMWEHLEPSRDVDHFPEPDLEALTEREAEEQLQFDRVDGPTHSVVDIRDTVQEQPSSRYL